MPDLFIHGYALLIGVGRCVYAPWSLPVTVQDMQALRAVLADPDLCGYPADHIRLLHDDGATRQTILDGLAWLVGGAHGAVFPPPPQRGALRPGRQRSRSWNVSMTLRQLRLEFREQSLGLAQWRVVCNASLA